MFSYNVCSALVYLCTSIKLSNDVCYVFRLSNCDITCDLSYVLLRVVMLSLQSAFILSHHFNSPLRITFVASLRCHAVSISIPIAIIFVICSFSFYDSGFSMIITILTLIHKTLIFIVFLVYIS